MDFTITMQYRPLCRGGCASPEGEIHQLSDGRWEDADGNKSFGRDDIKVALEALRKHSVYEHKVIVAIDSDVYPNDDFLKEFDNVSILKTSYVAPKDTGNAPIYLWRMSAALRDAFMSLDDEEWFCHSYIADLICAKEWDRPIGEAMMQYGDNYVYVPMMIEPQGKRANIDIMGMEPDPKKIWDEWRKKISIHALSLPVPKDYNGVITEEQFDYFVKRGKEGKKGCIVERCGVRQYGYYALIILKAKYAKAIGFNIGPGFDLDFDTRLGEELAMDKVVVTESYVLHTVYAEFQWSKGGGRG